MEITAAQAREIYIKKIVSDPLYGLFFEKVKEAAKQGKTRFDFKVNEPFRLSNAQLSRIKELGYEIIWFEDQSAYHVIWDKYPDVKKIVKNA